MTRTGLSPSRRRLPLSLAIGLTMLVAMTLLAIIGPPIWGTQAQALTTVIRGSSSHTHPLGTDALGRDMLARTLAASRLTLEMAALATAIAVGAGMALGSLVVLAGRRVRSVGERLIDLLVAYPPVIVAIAVTAIFRPSERSVIIAIGVAFTPQIARLTNTLASSVREKDYVLIAEQLGVRPLQLLRRHIVPNLAGPLLVLASVGFGTAILTLSGLSFIGLGIQEPASDWGQLLSTALRDLDVNPIEIVGPTVAILITGLAAGLVGDGLAQYLDPRNSVALAHSHLSVSTAESRSRFSRVGVGSTPIEARTPAPNQLRGVSDAAVSVTGLRIRRGDGASLVRGVTLTAQRGEVLGIVGESGSGKTLTAMALARLLPPALAWSADELRLGDLDLVDAGRKPPKALATEIGVVFQDPSSSFNPARRIGPQLTEVARVHQHRSRRDAQALAIERLRECQVSLPELRMRQFPHELSGGMRQRAMIAMALMSSPKLLIADEPTTALDVTVQAEVLRLLRRLNVSHAMAIILVSHDIKVVSALCDRVCVMYGGRIVEELSAASLRAAAVCHPYTRALLAASPRLQAVSRIDHLRALPGRPPQPGTLVAGCSFAPRCPLAIDNCFTVEPELRPMRVAGGVAACHATDGPLAETLIHA